MRTHSAWLAGAGLFASAGAWALHQETGTIVASWACKNAAPGIWMAGAAALLLLLGGAAFSGIGWRKAGSGVLSEDVARPRRFLALVALMASALFLYAMALQAMAAFFLPGCME